MKAAVFVCFAGSMAFPAHAQQGMNVSRMWAESCLSCHAQDASKDLRSIVGMPVGDIDREFFDAITHGVPEMGMNAFGDALSEQEVWALTVYIRELQFRDARSKGMGTELAPDGPRGTWKTQHHDFTTRDQMKPDAIEVPWAVQPLPQGGALLTDRSGGVYFLSSDRELSGPVAGTPDVVAQGQGGMLDIAIDPEYATNGYVYLSYSDPGETVGRDRRGRARVASMTRVDRGRIENNTWVPVNTVFKAPESGYVATGFHYGTRLVIDRDGYIFIPIGDRGIMEHAQDLSRPNGKVHRVKTDGSIPEDNPFVGVEGALPTIYSLGHRNPQGLVMDSNGELWTTEHGPRGGDELNHVKRAHNYGWPVVSFGINYSGMPFNTPWPDMLPSEQAAGLAGEGSANGVEMPVHVWTPSTAVCGMAIVSGDAFPEWEGDILAGGLAMQTVQRVRIDERGEVAEVEEIFWGQGRVRDVEVGPNGAIWIALERPGRVIKLSPAP